MRGPRRGRREHSRSSRPQRSLDELTRGPLPFSPTASPPCREGAFDCIALLRLPPQRAPDGAAETTRVYSPHSLEAGRPGQGVGSAGLPRASLPGWHVHLLLVASGGHPCVCVLITSSHEDTVLWIRAHPRGLRGRPATPPPPRKLSPIVLGGGTQI